MPEHEERCGPASPASALAFRLSGGEDLARSSPAFARRLGGGGDLARGLAPGLRATERHYSIRGSVASLVQTSEAVSLWSE